MGLETLYTYEQKGLLRSQTHPTLPLTIWNYTETVQYEGLWDDITLSARGLVTDHTGCVVARPFRKFFNIEEGKHTPTPEFEVYEKMDGSLGILFYYKGEWIFASRGSFISDQCVKFKEIFESKYNASHLSTNTTYLFEIIYPENRIVVNYGDTEDVIMLGAIDTLSGVELNLDFYRNTFNIVKKYHGVSDYTKLKAAVLDNAEGFVVRFSNGDRMKVKGEEYIRLHKVMTNLSTTAIWEVLSSGGTMDTLLTDVPDEFYDKIKEYENLILDSYWSVANLADAYFREFYVDGFDGKTFEQHINWMPKVYQSLMWAQFNIKMQNYSHIIWNYIRPDFQKL